MAYLQQKLLPVGGTTGQRFAHRNLINGSSCNEISLNSDPGFFLMSSLTSENIHSHFSHTNLFLWKLLQIRAYAVN